MILPLLKNYLNAPIKRLDKVQSSHSSTVEKEIIEHIKNNVGRVQAWLFTRYLTWLRQGINRREAMRFQRTRLFGVYRILFLAIGHQWAQQGLLKQQRDIFFLSWEELLAYAEGRSVQHDWQALIEIRKSYYHQQKEIINLKKQFTTHGPIYQNNLTKMTETTQQVNTDSLQGKGCYPGVVEGIVRIILSPTDSLDLKDAILCTSRTDPGWTPLFIGLKGVIVEHGSLLSHSAILARELGIPTIVNVAHATTFLRDGDRVRMDGQTGEVIRLHSSNTSLEKTEPMILEEG